MRTPSQPEEVFIHLLKRLSMPAPTWSSQPDVVVDHENLMTLIVSNSSFLERHWRKLVSVLRSTILRRVLGGTYSLSCSSFVVGAAS